MRAGFVDGLSWVEPWHQQNPRLRVKSGKPLKSQRNREQAEQYLTSQNPPRVFEATDIEGMKLPAAGSYRVVVKGRSSHIGGRCHVQINGKQVGKQICTYSAATEPNEAWDLGPVDFATRGPHCITIKNNGRHKDSLSYAMHLSSIVFAFQGDRELFSQAAAECSSESIFESETDTRKEKLGERVEVISGRFAKQFGALSGATVELQELEMKAKYAVRIDTTAEVVRIKGAALRLLREKLVEPGDDGNNGVQQIRPPKEAAETPPQPAAAAAAAEEQEQEQSSASRREEL